MKFIKINKTTLSDLTVQDEIRIEICHGDKVEAVDYVSFAKLEKWVASVREQIIKSSKGQAKCCKNMKPDVFGHDKVCPICLRHVPPAR